MEMNEFALIGGMAIFFLIVSIILVVVLHNRRSTRSGSSDSHNRASDVYGAHEDQPETYYQPTSPSHFLLQLPSTNQIDDQTDFPSTDSALVHRSNKVRVVDHANPPQSVSRLTADLPTFSKVSGIRIIGTSGGTNRPLRVAPARFTSTKERLIRDCGYRVEGGELYGRIPVDRYRLSSKFMRRYGDCWELYIHPSEQVRRVIQSGEHGPCFFRRENGWYFCHFRNLSDPIQQIRELQDYVRRCM